MLEAYINKALVIYKRLKHDCVFWLAMAFLYAAKPFGKINTILWRIHKKLLDWNK